MPPWPPRIIKQPTKTKWQSTLNALTSPPVIWGGRLATLAPMPHLIWSPRHLASLPLCSPPSILRLSMMMPSGHCPPSKIERGGGAPPPRATINPSTNPIMRLPIDSEFSSAITHLTANPFTGSVRVVFTSSDRQYTMSASRRAIIGALLMPPLSVGGWVNQHCFNWPTILAHHTHTTPWHDATPSPPSQQNMDSFRCAIPVTVFGSIPRAPLLPRAAPLAIVGRCSILKSNSSWHWGSMRRGWQRHDLPS